MGLVTLKEILSESIEKKYAVGAFDTLDDNFTEAIIEAAEEEGLPVILMIPNFFWEKNDLSFYFTRLLDRCRRATVPVCLHLDHGRSFEDVMKAIHGGCTSVMFDGSALPIEENIAVTRKVVEAAHACGVSVEAEIGHVASPEGELQASEADETMYTSPEDAAHFVQQTQVDALAVAVGTVHGIYKGTPKIDTRRLDEIRSRVSIPLVLHGGSGLPEEEFRAAIAHGINKVNFFTGLSLEAVKAIRQTLDDAPTGKVHYIELKEASHTAVKNTIKHQMKIFGTLPFNRKLLVQ
ncbi:MAG: class II fructose-bisphosphate aldolase [Eubacteriales bacterium]|nr:class II fructose-bisphosphate aldolase [Eubacteriales bacterium]